MRNCFWRQRQQHLPIVLAAGKSVTTVARWPFSQTFAARNDILDWFAEFFVGNFFDLDCIGGEMFLYFVRRYSRLAAQILKATPLDLVWLYAIVFEHVNQRVARHGPAHLLLDDFG